MQAYGKVHRLGKSEVSGIMTRDVFVQEKLDGSQFSFGVSPRGMLWAASRGGLIDLDAPQKMFAGAVQTVKALDADGRLSPGITFRGEVISARRHNKLTYERVPPGYIVLFDVQVDDTYTCPAGIADYAYELGLEHAQVLAGPGNYTPEQVTALAEGPSQLGGQREGCVIKEYAHEPGTERMKAKVVGKLFHEKMGTKPSKGSDIQQIVEQYRTEAHWDKCIQHLRDEGALTGTPRDIGALMKEHASDLTAECEAEIRDVLWPRIWKQIVKGCAQGLPEHYLAYLDKK